MSSHFCSRKNLGHKKGLAVNFNQYFPIPSNKRLIDESTKKKLPKTVKHKNTNCTIFSIKTFPQPHSGTRRKKNNVMEFSKY